MRRISKLEQVSVPVDQRELLTIVRFIDNPEVYMEKAAIMMIFQGDVSKSFDLNSNQFADYEEARRNNTSDGWLAALCSTDNATVSS